jgi:hypothetical protein
VALDNTPCNYSGNEFDASDNLVAKGNINEKHEMHGSVGLLFGNSVLVPRLVDRVRIEPERVGE